MKHRNPQRKSPAAGIDPSRECLEVASGSSQNRVYHKVPVEPSVGHVLKSIVGDAAVGVENPGSLGKLALLSCQAAGVQIKGVHPMISRRFREMLNEEHTDLRDAHGIALCAATLSLPTVQVTDEGLQLHALSLARERMVRQQTADTNRLRALLHQTYGIWAKTLFPGAISAKALRFFQRFPTLDRVQDHRRAAAKVYGTSLHPILPPRPRTPSLTQDALALEVQWLCERILLWRRQRAQVDAMIRKAAAASKPFQPLATLPGLGAISYATLIGAIKDPRRFATVSPFLAFSGLAPCTVQSGSQRVRTRRRKRYHRGMKATFMRMALTQLRVNPHAQAYYHKKRKEGKPHFVALQATARQIAKIFFSMLKHNRPYSLEKP